MAWFKMDDGVVTHPKFAMIGAADMGVWAWGAAWASRELTNGHIPATVLPLLRGTPENAERLVAAGLWLEVEGGWQYHDWNDYQPAPDEVLALREKRKAAGRRGGKLSAQAKAQANAQASAQAKAKQVLEQEPSKSQASAQAKAKQRASTSQANLNPVPVPVPVDNSNELSNTYARDRAHDHATNAFDTFWEIYPRKAGKQRARAAWAKALKTATAQEIIDGARAFASDPNRDPQYTPHPTTWLNAGRWEDDPLPARSTGDRSMQAIQRDLERQRQSTQPRMLEIASERYSWEA